MDNSCKNNYTKEEFFTEFAKDENDLKKCNTCNNFCYENGMVTCKKFNNEGN